jgi:4-diphosphocytidyl-2-C-methyl-D-erythritol kinase
LVSGKGQILKKVDKIPEFLVLLVNPLIEVSTQRIFSSLKKTKNKKLEYDENAMKSDNILIFLNQKKNDLEEQAKLICKNISQILDYLKIETNSKLTRMTGSGATCFAIYDNVKDLNNAESLMKKKFKNFWVKKTKICNKI